MAKLTIEELVAAFKEFTLVELNEFVKAFEEEFDVTVATPVAAIATTPTAGGEAAAVEEKKDSFDAVLETTGDKKVAVIEEVRALTSFGLEEVKDFVDSTPKTVLEGVDKKAANKARKQFESAGASVTVKRREWLRATPGTLAASKGACHTEPMPVAPVSVVRTA